MKKNGFVTHVLSLGGKRAGGRTSRAKVPFIGEILPSYKRNLTMSKRGFRPKTHRAGENYYKGDRVRQGTWSKKRWMMSQKRDRARDGSKYESWEHHHK